MDTSSSFIAAQKIHLRKITQSKIQAKTNVARGKVP